MTHKTTLTHGGSKTSTYSAWRSMKQRCLEKNNCNYFRYGAVGIKICKRWMKFENFLADMGEKPGKGHTYSLDRIDGSKGYSPKNCRWATAKQQTRNAAQIKKVFWKGEKRLLCELAEEMGIPIYNAWERHIRYGWPLHRALTEPVRKRAT